MPLNEYIILYHMQFDHFSSISHCWLPEFFPVFHFKILWLLFQSASFYINLCGILIVLLGKKSWKILVKLLSEPYKYSEMSWEILPKYIPERLYKCLLVWIKMMTPEIIKPFSPFIVTEGCENKISELIFSSFSSERAEFCKC